MSEIVILTGMSGAGRSTAADVFDDLGWFVIDNLPTSLIPTVVDLAEHSERNHDRIVLVVGREANSRTDDLLAAIDSIKSKSGRVQVLFLEASDEVLIRRFEGTRRRHPIESTNIADAIKKERVTLSSIRAMADMILETGSLNVHELKTRILDHFANSGESAFDAQVVSFGFSYGVPTDVDMMFDVRFLANPYWDVTLREFSGIDKNIKDYVLGFEEAKQFLTTVSNLLDVVLPGFTREGKSYLSIGIGCTGGRHRSVVIAEEIANILKEKGLKPSVRHRDIEA